jgi:3-hydroxyisobutyrate dehydrogenase
MLLGKRLGVDSQVLADIINNSTGRCWSSEVRSPAELSFAPQVTCLPHINMANVSAKINHPVPDVKVSGSSPPAHRNYDGGFVTKLAHKDLALAVSAAGEVDVPLTVGRCAEEAYRPLAVSEKFGNRDFSVIYEALDAMNSSVGNPKP